MPCRKRAATKAPSELESPQKTEPVTKTPIAARKIVREPNRSAIHPETGMKTARLTRYDVRASFMARGLSPSEVPIIGSEVAMTVESICSMKSAQATMSGMRTVRETTGSRVVKTGKERKTKAGNQGTR